MEKIVLYTTGCPRCNILKDILKKKNIPFEENNDIDEMIRLGFSYAPVLKINENAMDFNVAVEWLSDK